MTGGSLSDVVALLEPLALDVASLGPGVAFWDSGEMQTVTLSPGIAPLALSTPYAGEPYGERTYASDRRQLAKRRP